MGQALYVMYFISNIPLTQNEKSNLLMVSQAANNQSGIQIQMCLTSELLFSILGIMLQLIIANFTTAREDSVTFSHSV